MSANELVESILARARVKNLAMSRLADKAGIRPETLSRLKRRDNFDVETLRRLALAVGCKLVVVPLSETEGDVVYSPQANARAKQEARHRDEELIHSGAVSALEIHRRNGLFAFPAPDSEVK